MTRRQLHALMFSISAFLTLGISSFTIWPHVVWTIWATTGSMLIIDACGWMPSD